MKIPIFSILVILLVQNLKFSKQDDQKLDWWQRAVFYQIFPSSFKDSDGDGMGDLGGILEKMDFFTDMGVDAIWLSPIYKSPMVDGGYDISDYYDIAPQYGNLSIFQKLVDEAHNRGLKVILDFVPNHTSNKHQWFQKSELNDTRYKDYYVWENCVKNQNGSFTYPNNWLSVWGGSIWKYSEIRKQCYLHQFSYQQPDLNFEHQPVHDEMKKIMIYWLDKGVDGFRVDAVPHIYESSNHSENEPINPNSNLPSDNYNYFLHTLTKDQPESKQLIYDWRKFIDAYSKKNGSHNRILMTEAATDLANSVTYYGTTNGSQLGAHFSFNFWLIGMTNKTRPDDIYNAINSWSKVLPKIYTMNWLTGNHDNPRIATTVLPRNADGYNMILMFLDAVTITYMGEEIGMENGEVTCEQGQDPSAKNCSTFNTVSRDFERTPYQWDESVNAGFSVNSSTWLPVSSKYKETNLELENKTATTSHYHVYKTLVKLKQELSKKTQLGDLILQKPYNNSDVLQITRILNSETYSLVFNMGNKTWEDVILVGSNNLDNNNSSCTVLAGSVNSTYQAGDIFDGLKVTLKPGDSMIIKIGKSEAAAILTQNPLLSLIVTAFVKYIL